MTNFFLKVRIWTKVVVLGAIALYVLFFLWNNNQNVSVWLWPSRTIDTSMLVLIPAVFFLGVMTAALIRTVLRTVTQFRELKTRKLERDSADIIARAAKLRTRENATTLQPLAPPPGDL